MLSKYPYSNCFNCFPRCQFVVRYIFGSYSVCFVEYSAPESENLLLVVQNFDHTPSGLSRALLLRDELESIFTGEKQEAVFQ